MSRLSALHPLSCGGRQRTQNVDASRFPAGSRQGSPVSTSHNLGSAQFRAGQRQTRWAALGFATQASYLQAVRACLYPWVPLFGFASSDEVKVNSFRAENLGHLAGAALVAIVWFK